ncbi:glycoside hydrolase family 2 protein [Lapidilactobacillus bayanensis]|uniref:glycoside hydrolase family 2 protein n=1 Tax=Lapidilactobacillus bayanensis TaxID=2485998 RepID=UPI000F7B939C|nr:sugar-binding domain-containing protein [Lapidilactobacillus bayanensis]
MTIIPRPEHPQPQFQRQNWRNLNGQWQFEFDFGKSGRARKWYQKHDFSQEITVPFCPESELSGIHYTDFIAAVWYQKTFEISQAELAHTTLIHFGAVDYSSEVYVNGQSVGTHRGGYSSFSFDISQYLIVGENVVTVYAEDDVRSYRQPKGKQSSEYYSHGCDYTRTTGIWQTVWLEFLPQHHLNQVKFYPNVTQGFVTVETETVGHESLNIEVYYQGQLCGQAIFTDDTNHQLHEVKLDQVHLWKVGAGRLYDVKLTYGEDKVASYFGLREIQMDGYRFLLNGQPVFERLVLDQGFYPDGIYTAPTDAALQKDIQLSLDCGFNGARLHQKAFEPRFLYHADQMGYLVWGEMASWGIDLSANESILDFVPEWQEIVARDFNHPAIVTWCPLNETWNVKDRPQINDIVKYYYQVTKQLDPTRPCVDTSGNYHVQTDIYDLHDYEQDPEKFATHYAGEHYENGEFRDEHDARQQYTSGLPFGVSEYGGIKWDPNSESETAWGYGEAPQTMAEFMNRYRGLTEVLLNHPRMFGFCYTQLYDVEQERNGLYYYDRTPKFNVEELKAINQQIALSESPDLDDRR